VKSMGTNEAEANATNELRMKALRQLAARSGMTDLAIVYVATDVVPSSKLRIYQFFAASKARPNEPRYVIVLDAQGEEIDLDRLRNQEGVELFAPRDTEVKRIAERGSGLGAAEPAVTISPTENDLTLSPGDTHGPEVITVFIPRNAASPKVDVYFLADTTGSMSPILEALKASARDILAALTLRVGDVAFGVGSYKDFPGVAFEHHLAPTTTLDAAGTMAVETAIDSWSASGGGDTPEGQLFALDRIAADVDGAIGWRFNARRIVVWFGDAPGHDPVCASISGLATDITEGRLTGNLIRANITLIAISTTTGPGLDADPNAGATDYVPPPPQPACTPRGSPSQATRLADATGGVVLTDISPATITDAIIRAVTVAAQTINRVELDAAGAASDFVTAITPARGFGPFSTAEEHTLSFQVTFGGTKPCRDDGPQVFEGFIAVKVDGDVVGAIKTLRVTVPACEHFTEMREAPSAAVGARDSHSTRQINVFVLGTDNDLLCWSHVGDPTSVSSWSFNPLDRPGAAPGVRLLTAPFGATDIQDQISRAHDHVHVFAIGEDGHLHERVWDGLSWSRWIDQGQPNGRTGTIASPTAALVTQVSQYDETGIFGLTTDTTYLTHVSLSAYAWGSDGWLYHFDQVWEGHGRPPNGASIASVAGAPARSPDAIAYAFVVGTDGRLYVTSRPNLGPWSWRDLGMPNPVSSTGVAWWFRPGIARYRFEARDLLYTFVGGTDGHLWIHVWSGVRGVDLGTWSDHGMPAAGVLVSSAVSVVTCRHTGAEQIYAFVLGSDHHLYLRMWNAGGGTWSWRDLGVPPRTTVRSDPSAVVCELAGADPLYVFVRGEDRFLYMCHLDSGATPTWAVLR